MKKTIITIISIVIIIPIMYFGYTKYQENNKYVDFTQSISKTGFNISLKYNSENWDIKHSDKIRGNDYHAGVRLIQKENEDVYIYIAYDRDLHQYTKEELSQTQGDTGGEQYWGEAIVLDMDGINNKVEKITELRGQEIYMDVTDNDDTVLYQKLGEKEYTPDMAILNKNPKELIPRQQLGISADFKPYGSKITDEEAAEIKKEFIEIVKSIKITEIKK